MDMGVQHRFDVATAGSVSKTPQGFLRIDANLTRVGVLNYRRADGSVFRELRLPEEVFRADSLASMRGAPVTDLHPRELVTPSNVTSHQRGHVADDVREDGRFVRAQVVVQDAGLMRRVQAGERKELSPGYTCDVEAKSGVWRGQRYDGIQRNIVYNHVALGPNGWGRSGSEVSLKLDSADDDFAIEIPPETRHDGGEPKGRSTMLIRFDDVSYDVPDAVAPHIEKALSARDTRIKELQAKVDAAEARADMAESKAKETQTKLDAANDPKAFASRVKARVNLERRALAIVGSDETKLDGLSDREIRELAIQKARPDINLDGQSDEYVRAAFDWIPVPNKREDAKRQREAVGKGLANRNSETKTDSEKARQDMIERNANLWKQPLAANKKALSA